MPASLSWTLALTLGLLVATAVAVSHFGGLTTSKAAGWAAGRAVVQLVGVSLIIATVLGSIVLSLLFVLVMLAVAVATSARRIQAAHAWPWVALAMSAGVVPVLLLIFGCRAVPVSPSALVSLSGIVIGGAMTANSLNGRRCFAALREEHSAYEAGLSIGLQRAQAISEIVQRQLRKRLCPVWTKLEPSGWSPCQGRSSESFLEAAARCRPAQPKCWCCAGYWPPKASW